MSAAVHHGGRVVVDRLRRLGVDTVFTVPGESFLAVLDALHDEGDMRLVVCRHESGAGIMAEALARLRNHLGVCIVTRGPGATHASIAVHNASMSGAALLLLVGQVPTAHRGRGAFQEVDYEAFFAPMAKWAVEVDRPERLDAVIAEAARRALAGRPGPVVVSLPEDVLAAEVSGPDTAATSALQPDSARRPDPMAVSLPADVLAAEVSGPDTAATSALQPDSAGRPDPMVVSLPKDVLAAEVSGPDTAATSALQPDLATRTTAAGPPVPGAEVVLAEPREAPSAADLSELRSFLAGAARPLVIVGGPTWSAAAAEALAGWAERNHLPVAVSFRRQDYIDNRSAAYVGHAGVGIPPSLARRIGEADLIVAIGTRLGDTATKGYTLLEPPVPRQRLVHIHPDATELGRVYQAHLAICAGAVETVLALAAHPALPSTPWQAWAADARADYEASLTRRPAPGAVDVGEIVAWLSERLPPEAILTNGAGNFSLWPQRFYTFRQYGTQLGPQSGAMGYAVPAAVAAKLHTPEAPVVAFSGDGDFLMTGQELATAVRYRLPIVVLVINNGMFASIRMHQERSYPDRVSGSDLTNPDFAAYARAFGAHGALVERTEDFAAAFEEALGSGLPAVLEVRVDPEAMLPGATLSEIRRTAQGS